MESQRPVYSMREWKPENVLSKIQRIEHEIQRIDELRIPLVNEKRRIEAELVEVNAILKSEFFKTEEFNKINSKRGQLIKAKTEVDIKISELKRKNNKLNTERESAKIDLKKNKNDLIKNGLEEMRDKYLSFAADTTRVSSMRSMASKFVEEIQSLLEYVV